MAGEVFCHVASTLGSRHVAFDRAVAVEVIGQPLVGVVVVVGCGELTGPVVGEADRAVGQGKEPGVVRDAAS